MTKRQPKRLPLVTSFALIVVGLVLPLAFAVPAMAAPSPATSTTTGGSSASGQHPLLPAPAGPPVGNAIVTPGPTTSTVVPSTPAATPGAAANTSSPQAQSASLIGSGSSFAGPEVLQWTSDTAKPPYSLTVNYTPDSSGQGRFDFGGKTVDFAVSDIPYQGQAFDTQQPSFPFIYVPVTAGGLAFMYHLSGLSTTLHLSSYSICALMSGAIATWNDRIIRADNPGVALPATPVHPVIRGDLAGTNFVLQEYCIHEQPALWRAFVTSPAIVHYPNQVGDLSPTDPRSDWPQFPGAVVANGSSNAADDVASPNANGYFTAVETAYAIQRNIPVASVKNASGQYTQPDAVGVASALAYATQNANGTHNLNFDGVGPHVYNPSTYSYLLTPTTGWSAAKGATMSSFANYALTLGQQKAPEIGYASLGLSLEQYGVNSIKQSVPGAVPLTAAEQGAYACGDLTPSEVQAGQTQPTCGVTNPNDSSTPGTAAHGGSSSTTGAGGGAGGAGGGTGSGAGGTGSGAGGGAGGVNGTGSTTGASINPGVSLGDSPTLATTGGVPLPVAAAGFLLAGIGWVARRRILARMR